MDFFAENVERLQSGKPAAFPEDAGTVEFARTLDAQDELRHFRDEYLFPTKTSLKTKSLRRSESGGREDEGDGEGEGHSHDHGSETAIYLCGNSLGLQPKAVRGHIEAQLNTWASVGVYGHFSALEGSPMESWQDLAEQCARQSADVAGASPGEIVVMNSLTVNLHLLMASFYRPAGRRHKIILEWKPFPSDYYAIESHIRWHGLDPAASMVEVPPEADDGCYLATDRLLAVIDAHADDAALVLLPGVQYYSGQLLDVARITAHARGRGIVVGWDLAHAAGNVELRLHDWGVDFAAWCTYKYLNAGPGAIAAAFVHERHGGVQLATAAADSSSSGGHGESHHVFRPRLAGWYGGDKAVRFDMAKTFQPTPGAAGFQLSNPSVLDLAALSAALGLFQRAGMARLRRKSLLLTAYAEHLLTSLVADEAALDGRPAAAPPAFRVITPADPAERGAQLSLLLRPGLLDAVSAALREAGVVCDQRKPDVIRLAPVPMYNTFEDVRVCVEVLRKALGVVS